MTLACQFKRRVNNGYGFFCKITQNTQPCFKVRPNIFSLMTNSYTSIHKTELLGCNHGNISCNHGEDIH